MLHSISGRISDIDYVVAFVQRQFLFWILSSKPRRRQVKCYSDRDNRQKKLGKSRRNRFHSENPLNELSLPVGGQRIGGQQNPDLPFFQSYIEPSIIVWQGAPNRPSIGKKAEPFGPSEIGSRAELVLQKCDLEFSGPLIYRIRRAGFQLGD